MIGKRTAIWKREEYSYESEERDIPYVISYMHEDGQIRPAMIVVPGGAYRQVSSSEGDIVARTFYRAGYNALVLTYSRKASLCTFSRLEIWPERCGSYVIMRNSAGSIRRKWLYADFRQAGTYAEVSEFIFRI